MRPLGIRAGGAIGSLLLALLTSACVAEAPVQSTRTPAAAARPSPQVLIRPALASPSVSAAPTASAAPAPGTAQAQQQTYTVAAGDTLSSIASRFYNDASQWRPIFEANRDRLSTPEGLQIGMSLRIPPRSTPTPAR
jgi:nucleoid-associated protein YgaU